ncbi:methyltransferase family protein [Actinocrispum wychmicini]|uniref:Methyltransferase family protein n=1 Tax=Actinocrispum wychmicini TaxID=1213861 RepID=A0A4R2JNB8_9PSEU|nr:methyltransferase family protein [Actinocrispum wychmicini]
MFDAESDHLQTIIHGATAFELLRTAIEFDLFRLIEDNGGLDLAGVAGRLGVPEQPARVLLLGLASLRLLTKKGETYVNAPVTKRSLLPTRPGYLGPLVEIQEKITNPGLRDFAESMRRDTNVGLRHLEGPGTTLYERVTVAPDLQQVFYNNMGHASRQTFPLVARTFDFSKLRHVIDIGGGDGSNGIELAKRYPELEVTVFDQESVLPIAKRNAVEAGVGDRFHGSPGDLFTDTLPTGADGILFCHIFEIWSLERNTELLAKCYDALPPGGCVLVYNFVSDNDNTGSVSAAFMSVYFLTVASGEGMVYSEQDMRASLTDAGFSRIESYEGVGYRHALLVGYK